jgi:aspartyl-tRNA(Asn)/glutamyl-tRNA(Gln) amidotransferase subunit A
MPWTISQEAQRIRTGQRTPVELLDSCLQVIDRHEERVKAWVFVAREEARREAERLTAEAERGAIRGPLHGIPLAIKDIIDVFDWPTAAGSSRWERSYARDDATVVRRLRSAGAILLGKTVTTQYASFDPPVTRNPWDSSRTPGGSSSGTAAAIASGMCPAGLGSQTGGSITRPASFCGVAGLKPTLGRVSTHGVLPLAPSMDHVGPLAHCVQDLALLLQTIAGQDVLDPACATRPVGNWTALLDRPQEKPRLGRLRGPFDSLADPGVIQMMDQVTERFSRAGAALTEIALPASFGEVIARHRTVMAVEAAAIHEPRFRAHPEDYAPKITALLEEGLGCSAAVYARCKEHQRLVTRELLPCFEGVDAFLTPATVGPAPDASTTGDPAFNSPWSYTGLPTISLPASWSGGLPLSIQLVGRHWGEGELCRVAAWCERVIDFERRSPPLVGQSDSQ